MIEYFTPNSSVTLSEAYIYGSGVVLMAALYTFTHLLPQQKSDFNTLHFFHLHSSTRKHTFPTMVKKGPLSNFQLVPPLA